MNKTKITLLTASSIVIANMIGTGVFTSLGFQLSGGITHGFSILMLWLTGGVLSFCGALCYAELSARFPGNGGEFHFLTQCGYPVLGFLSGFVSATVGFAAPIALSAMALGQYFEQVAPMLPAKLTAVITLLGITLLHARSVESGSRFQNAVTIGKTCLIALFIVLGLILPDRGDTPFNPINSSGSNAWKEILSPAFAVSLVYVSYAYSGWNAAAYLGGEINNPGKNVPRALLGGTLVVCALYVLLHVVFLLSAPAAALSGQLEIGFISAESMLGAKFGQAMALLITFFLISSVSSMVFAGPRVTQSMGAHYPALSVLAKRNRLGAPHVAVMLQSAISFLFILTSSFEATLTYVGFTLNLFTFLTVLAYMRLRMMNREPAIGFKVPFFPLPALAFLLLNGWMLWYLLTEKPTESLAGLSTLLIGYLVYLLSNRKTHPHP